MSSWSGPPRIFSQTGNERVNNIFGTVYDSGGGVWRYPIFFSSNDYTGETSPISVSFASGVALNAYRSADNAKTSTTKPERFPVIASQSCSQKCIRSSSEYLQYQKHKNMLMAVQNKGIRTPFCDYQQYLTYQNAKQLIIPYYTC